MGSDGEGKISSAIAQIHGNEQTTDNKINNLIHVNTFTSEQIKNITNHIIKQQVYFSSYINALEEIAV